MALRASELSGDDRAGDDREFEAFYSLYVRRVRGFVRRRVDDPSSVDDVVQETFLRAYRAGLHREAGRDRTPRSAWPWLAAVTNNLIVDLARRRRPVVTSDEVDDHAGVCEDTTEGAYWRHARGQAIADALGEIHPRHRRLLGLRHIAGWEQGEIAARDGVSLDAVKMSLSRARHSFRVRYSAIAEERGLAGVVGGLLGRLGARLRLRLARASESLQRRGLGVSAGIETMPGVLPAAVAAVVLGAVAVSGPLATPAPGPARATVYGIPGGTPGGAVRGASALLVSAPGRGRTGDGGVESAASGSGRSPAGPDGHTVGTRLSTDRVPVHHPADVDAAGNHHRDADDNETAMVVDLNLHTDPDVSGHAVVPANVSCPPPGERSTLGEAVCPVIVDD